MVSATCRLCSAESCVSGVGILAPSNPGILTDAQSSTKPHKAVAAEARHSGVRLNKADQYARARPRRFAQLKGDANTFGSQQMMTCDGIQTDSRTALLRIMRLLLFAAMQGAAVILIGFAALFLSFEPGWSAGGQTAAPARPGDARSGSLLLKTDNGYADATRLGIDVALTVSGPTVRARV